MGIFNTPPPLDPKQLNNLNPADFTSQGAQLAQGFMTAGWWDSLIAAWWRYFTKGASTTLNFFFNVVEETISFGVEIIGKLQGAQGGGFSDLVATVLSDLLWVEISGTDIANAFTAGGRKGAVSAAGQALFNVLSGEFSASAPGGTITASTAGAVSFVGYLIEFAIREGNLGFMSEFLPEEFNFLKGFREYGTNLAGALGLGRLGRRALTPLVQILCSDPLTWSLNQQYRPKLLGPSELVRGFYRGKIDQDTMDQQLAWQGYSDMAIQAILADNTKQWSTAELIDLARWGAITDDQAVLAIQATGIGQGDAQQTWQAAKNSHLFTFETQILHEAFSAYKNGIIGLAAMQDWVSKSHLLPEEQAGWADVIAAAAFVPRKHLSESDVENSFLEGISTLSDVQAYWQGLGYSAPAIQTLTLLLLNKQGKTTKTVSGSTGKKRITEAQLEKALGANIISLDEFKLGLTNLGYPAGDIEVLAALAQGQAGQPGSPLLPGLNPP